jgi:hypothetical protein
MDKVVKEMTTEAMRSHPDWAQLRNRPASIANLPALRAVDGLTFLAGLYLAISPWVVGFNGISALSANNLIVGAALAMLALWLSPPSRRADSVAWVVPIVGAWTIIAPWVVSGDVATAGTVWNNLVTGIITVLIGLAAMSLRMTRAD